MKKWGRSGKKVEVPRTAQATGASPGDTEKQVIWRSHGLLNNAVSSIASAAGCRTEIRHRGMWEGKILQVQRLSLGERVGSARGLEAGEERDQRWQDSRWRRGPSLDREASQGAVC